MWIAKDRSTVWISDKKLKWDKDLKLWEQPLGSCCEAPKNFVRGLKRGQQIQITHIKLNAEAITK